MSKTAVILWCFRRPQYSAVVEILCYTGADFAEGSDKEAILVGQACCFRNHVRYYKVFTSLVYYCWTMNRITYT